MRWLLVIVVATVVLATLQPWLQKFGLGRLPGDINFRIGRRNVSIPLASSVLIGLVVLLIGRLI